MSTTNVQALERAAIDAHARGAGWSEFWTEHGAAVCQAEPHDRHRFARLVRRLLSLVISGDVSGMEPAADQTDVPAEASQCIDWYAEGEERIVEAGGIRIAVRFVGRKGRRGRITITAPPGASFRTSDRAGTGRSPVRLT